MQGERVVRMVPYKGGKANDHSCVNGRFAYGYAPTRTASPADDPREDHGSVARGLLGGGIDRAASEFKRIQAKYGKDSVGGITSSRCTNEEAYPRPEARARPFGNNNVDTCARVCHSPTGYA